MLSELSAADTVDKLPHYIKPLQDILLKTEGESAHLTCTVAGKPKPDVVWYFNGRALPIDSKDHTVKSSEGVHTVDIKKVTRQLCGVYTIRATNSLGDSHSTMTLRIVEEGTTSHTC